MRTFPVFLNNSLEGIQERTRTVNVPAETPEEAVRKVWDTPEGNAFRFVHCHIYPRATATHRKGW